MVKIDTNQGRLVFDPPVRQKNVRPTSVEAYRAILDDMPFRERCVMWGLLFCARRLRRQPTAYEILEFMRPWGAFDLNTVRPRLTSLKDQGLLTNLSKRPCSVTSRTAYTWDLTELGHRALRGYPEPRPETLAIHRATRRGRAHVEIAE